MRFDFLAWWESFSEAPFVLLIILLLITHFFYYRYFRHAQLTVASPSIMMALGGFALVCMPELHINISLMLLFAIELVLLWTYITIALLYSYAHGMISFSRPLNKLEMGTWVAGTALTMLVIDQIEPTLYGFILWLGLASLVFYIVYFCLMVQWLVVSWHRQVKIDGRVMLVAIATLSIALLIMEVFGHDVPVHIYQAIIFVGAAFSMIGALLIIIKAIQQCRRHFLATWSNTNCLIYAAFAMVGFAMLETHSFSNDVIYVDWCLTIICFVIVEMLEIIRLFIRIRIQQLKAINVYYVSQWLRIFALAMLHGFALSYYNHHYISSEWLALIANYAQYIVLALVVFELSLIAIRVVKHGEYT